MTIMTIDNGDNDDDTEIMSSKSKKISSEYAVWNRHIGRRNKVMGA